MATSSSISLQRSSDINIRTKSCDTACSSSSSCLLRKRKPPNPLMVPFHRSRNANNAVRERVRSAKILKLRNVQSQLNEANFHLAELVRENQTLKNLQRLQDKALAKYEGTKAELPRLLQSHQEEIRTLTERNRLLKKTVRDLNDQVKFRNDEIVNLQDRLKHLEKLDSDKGLLERERLTDQLESYKIKLRKAEDQVEILGRRLALESKSGKQKVNSEVVKFKECQKELSQALAENKRLSKLVPSNRTKVPPRQTQSMTCLTSSTESESISNQPSEDPPESDQRLEQITTHLQSTILKMESKTNQTDVDKRLGDYCLQAVDSVKQCSIIIDSQRKDLTNIKSDTDKLIKAVNEVQDAEAKLKHSNLLSLDMDKDDLVSEILSQELSFQKTYKTENNRSRGHAQVDLANKRRLLATLKAIDEGDDTETDDEC